MRLSETALPRPWLKMIFCKRGTCITVLYPNFSFSVGTISSWYCVFSLGVYIT